MLEVINQSFEDLTEDEQEAASNNGSGKEYAGYLRVIYNGETILFKSDAMEPEDVRFYRDLSWIPSIIRIAYEFGKSERD